MWTWEKIEQNFRQTLDVPKSREHFRKNSEAMLAILPLLKEFSEKNEVDVLLSLGTIILELEERSVEIYGSTGELYRVTFLVNDNRENATTTYVEFGGVVETISNHLTM